MVKLAITTSLEALYVDLIGPHTLKGKDKTVIDFMCITMIFPATSWFEIAAGHWFGLYCWPFVLDWCHCFSFIGIPGSGFAERRFAGSRFAGSRFDRSRFAGSWFLVSRFAGSRFCC